MRRAIVPAGLAAVVMAAITRLGTDYPFDAGPAVSALARGDIHGFVSAQPQMGPLSILLRAPLAAVAGADSVWAYRLGALVCLLGLVALGARIAQRNGAGAGVIAGALLVANPVSFEALDLGHPEELLGAALCAGAVLAAARQRPHLAALLLGLAIGNKAWAVLAVGPVFVALSRHRLRTVVLAGTIAVALTAPFVLGSGNVASADGAAVTTGSVIFQPWQAWWMLGDTGHVVRGGDGQVKPGYRTPPAWLARISHPLIAFMVVPFTLLWLRRRRGSRRGAPEDALLLLALLMLLRCVLDPWDTGYYHLPFLLALLSWETLSRERPPVLTLLATVAVWVTFETLPKRLGADAQSFAYVVWAVPATVALGWACLRGPRPAVARSGAAGERLPAVA
jgi:Glycosyltransferase family 87